MTERDFTEGMICCALLILLVYLSVENSAAWWLLAVPLGLVCSTRVLKEGDGDEVE